MTTPSERVQRLREETAKAVGAPWVIDDDNHLALATVLTPRAYGFGDSPYRIDTPDDATAHHIARWDPEAAEKVLDLLDLVFWRHGYYGKFCHCGRLWPCPDEAYALAVLDALDPPVTSPKGTSKETP